METIIGMFYLFVIPCIIAIVVNILPEKYFQNREDTLKNKNKLNNI